jgi:hypothetical protein
MSRMEPEEAKKLKRRAERQRERILKILRKKGYVTNVELSNMGILRYGARFDELREEGYRIATVQGEGGLVYYVLVEDKKEGEGKVVEATLHLFMDGVRRARRSLAGTVEEIAKRYDPNEFYHTLLFTRVRKAPAKKAGLLIVVRRGGNTEVMVKEDNAEAKRMVGDLMRDGSVELVLVRRVDLSS